MITSLKIDTAPATEILTTSKAKDYLRVTINDDNNLIDTMVLAARKFTELQYLHRALITQTWVYTLDMFPSEGVIEMPLPPLQSVTHIKYKGTDGVQTTWNASLYEVDTSSEPGRIVPAYGESWPSYTAFPLASVEVEFIAGYGLNTTDIPEDILMGVKLLLSHLYENRDIVVTGTIVATMGMSYDALLTPYRIRTFA